MAIIEQDMISTKSVVMQPMLTVSNEATVRLVQMMEEKELDGYALRVFVSGGGCSGMQYGMTFDDEMRDGDHEFQASALRVVVDPISANYLTGASIDFIDSLMGGGFKIDNPNAVSSCGCGHSFRTSESADDAAPSGGGCGSCG